MGCYKCGSEEGDQGRLCASCIDKKKKEIKKISSRTATTSSNFLEPLLSTQVAIYIILALIVLPLFVWLNSRNEFHIPHTTTRVGPSIILNRSHSSFIFDNIGILNGDYRVFGFNSNPFGSNNKDSYVESFGIGLLPTHLLVVTGKDHAAEVFAKEHCEQSLAGNMTMMATIAKDQTVASQLNALAQKGGRICLHLEGSALRFNRWDVEGKPQSAEIVNRMARESGGIHFDKPILIEKVSEISCS